MMTYQLPVFRYGSTAPKCFINIWKSGGATGKTSWIDVIFTRISA